MKPSNSDNGKQILENCFNTVNSLSPLHVNFPIKRSQLLLYCSDSSMNTTYFCLLLIWRHRTFAKGVTFWCWYPSTSIQPHYWNYQTVAFDWHIFITSSLYLTITIYLLANYIKLIEKFCLLIANTIGKIYFKLWFTFLIIFFHWNMV